MCIRDRLAGVAPASAQTKLPFHLGITTYNVLMDWDLDKIIQTLPGLGFEAVELRTTHKHLLARRPSFPSISASPPTTCSWTGTWTRSSRHFPVSALRPSSCGPPTSTC